MMEEKVMKKEGDGEHPSSHYLVVEDSTKPTTWHLRVRDVSGKVSHGLMGAAWAALHGGYRGNKYAGPNKAEALSKLTRLYHSEGIPVPSSKVKFFEDPKGMWFLGVYSNNFMDRQGEILSKEAHAEYASWVKQKGIKPPIVLLHNPKVPELYLELLLAGVESGRLTGKAYNETINKLYEPFKLADTYELMDADGFMFVLGKVPEDRKEVVKKLMELDIPLGMSHGFMPRTISDNIIAKYRTFEFSVVPLDMAANEWTLAEFSESDEKSMNDEQKELLIKLFGEDAADKADEWIEQTAKILQETGVVSKIFETKDETVEETETAEEEVTEVAEETVETPEIPVAEVNVTVDGQSIAETVLKALNLEALQATLDSYHTALQTLNEKVTAQEKVLAELQQTDDRRIASMFVPNYKLFETPTSQAEVDNEQTVDRLKGDLPEVTDAEKVANDPLVLGLWEHLGKNFFKAE